MTDELRVPGSSLLPESVVTDRLRFEADEEHNRQALAGRIEKHLGAQEVVINGMWFHHAQLVDETDLDPSTKDRGAGAWLLAGRCLSLAQAVTALLRAGFATEAEPTARSLMEACRVLALLQDEHDRDILTRWRRGGGWSKIKDLDKAEAAQEARIVAEMKAAGHTPPDSAGRLSKTIYKHLSENAHPQRRPVLGSWSPDIRRFLAGAATPTVRHAIWVSYSDEWIREAFLTVGTTLAKLIEPSQRVAFWELNLAPGFAVLDEVRDKFPLDPGSLTRW